MIVLNCRPGKYDTETVEGTPAFYNIRMKLRIHNVSAADFGTYRCMAKNSQGETTGDIELYGNIFAHMFLHAIAHKLTHVCAHKNVYAH